MVWWWITGAALGAIGLAVIGNEIEKNEKAQREYEEKKIKYYENIEELKQGIEKEKERNRKGYDNFDNLVQLHCLSFKNGDYAYKAKEDLKSIINNDYIAIDKIKEKQKELYIQIKNKFFKYNLVLNINTSGLLEGQQLLGHLFSTICLKSFSYGTTMSKKSA